MGWGGEGERKQEGGEGGIGGGERSESEVGGGEGWEREGGSWVREDGEGLFLQLFAAQNSTK